jgi:hypothetical protein
VKDNISSRIINFNPIIPIITLNINGLNSQKTKVMFQLNEKTGNALLVSVHSMDILNIETQQSKSERERHTM